MRTNNLDDPSSWRIQTRGTKANSYTAVCVGKTNAPNGYALLEHLRCESLARLLTTNWLVCLFKLTSRNFPASTFVTVTISVMTPLVNYNQRLRATTNSNGTITPLYSPSEAQHYLDWTKAVGKVRDEPKARRRANEVQAGRGKTPFPCLDAARFQPAGAETCSVTVTCRSRSRRSSRIHRNLWSSCAKQIWARRKMGRG
jgi:hypothetical protein